MYYTYLKKFATNSDISDEVKQILETYGIIRIPIKNNALYEWVTKNKRKYKKGLLTPDKLRIFKEIGLVERVSNNFIIFSNFLLKFIYCLLTFFLVGQRRGIITAIKKKYKTNANFCK